ncbi:MAG: K(+)-transporting ATPase subunit C [Eubacteriales bacterium]|nr:K(+)-transporting ATPase subunit C [Eubacteriales bacterium]
MKAFAKRYLPGIGQAFRASLVLMLVCGLAYPLLMTGLSALLFPRQAGGSLIEVEGTPVAAENVGQEFQQDYFLWSRPSACHYNVYTENSSGGKTYRDGTPFPGISSGSGNYGPSNPALAKRVETDIASFLERNPDIRREDIPTDLMTASGSGLDPHISPASAEVQIPRIVKASGLSEAAVRDIISSCTGGKLLGIFGEETVNVVKVNLAIAQAMGLIQR